MRLTRLLPPLVLMVTMAAALLGGLGSGLARLGWSMGSASQDLLLVHGPLMICGFLGTLLCLERAAALRDRCAWSMVVPAVNAAGALALLFVQNPLPAKLLLVLGSLGLNILFVLMLWIHPSRDVAMMACGAVCWLLGNCLWLTGWPVFAVVHLWTAFLLLTITGERLELSRVRRLSHVGERLLMGSSGIYLVGVLLTIFDLDAGTRILGIGAVLMAGWLLHYDIARRTIGQTGLARYIGVCLLIGYAWLGFGGAVAFWKGEAVAGFDYAVILHAFLLGFAFSMIFAHMPIILSALTGLHIDYHPVFYAHLVLLHVGLMYRTYGNLTQVYQVRRWGGMLNAGAVLLFLVVTLLTTIRSNVARSVQEPTR